MTGKALKEVERFDSLLLLTRGVKRFDALYLLFTGL